MIVRLYNSPRVVFQTPDDESCIAEPAISASIDASTPGLIVLNQEGREIVINQASVPDVIKVLRELVANGKEKR